MKVIILGLFYFFFHLGPCHTIFHNISNYSEKPYGQEKEVVPF